MFDILEIVCTFVPSLHGLPKFYREAEVIPFK